MPSWRPHGPCWRPFGPSWRPLEPSWRPSGPSLEAAWAILEASWAFLEAFEDVLEALKLSWRLLGGLLQKIDSSILMFGLEFLLQFKVELSWVSPLVGFCSFRLALSPRGPRGIFSKFCAFIWAGFGQVLRTITRKPIILKRL